MTKAYVGMSGGVDSSLTAALLVERGYDVTGVYMKNWTRDLPGMKCPWADDLADAKRVAVQLGVDFKVFDFEADYKQKVVDYMIDEYKAGRTPNPDIMCNQEVKFKLFLDTALEDGADMIAMGHYARVEQVADELVCSQQTNLRQIASADTSLSAAKLGLSQTFSPSQDVSAVAIGKFANVASRISSSAKLGVLKKAVDANKDQTYFLYRVTGAALGRTLLPIGEYTKPQVRKMAKERGLYTAAKKDSQGICFVGQIGIRDFLSQYVEQEPGDIVDQESGKILGSHDGAIFYTLGQRHGLDLGGGLPYYVVGKNMTKNEVYVTRDLDSSALWRKKVELHSVHWINTPPPDGTYDIRIRHRAPLIKAEVVAQGDKAEVVISQSQRAITTGQSVVIYKDDTCLGGGIVI